MVCSFYQLNSVWCALSQAASPRDGKPGAEWDGTEKGQGLRRAGTSPVGAQLHRTQAKWAGKAHGWQPCSARGQIIRQAVGDEAGLRPSCAKVRSGPKCPWPDMGTDMDELETSIPPVKLG